MPPLRAYNVVALAETNEGSRSAVLALESLEADDAKLGTVVMSATETAGDSSAPGTTGMDPEGVTGRIVPRAVKGALIGLVVGVLVVGGGALVFGVELPGALAAGAGGAAMFAVFGAIWSAFGAMGGSDAYRQTFVGESISDLSIVSLHTDDAEEAAKARRALAGHDDLRVYDVDQSGTATPAGA
ncbi:MAG: hypothetical protein H0U01_05605 [Acidimicrobiia bacterium]|nr:hypothetical protein [Acidimicrobiia bacterium]